VLREIFSFELRYHLRSPVFWLAGVVFFLLSFGAVTTDVVVVGGAIGNVNRNAPYVIMQILGVMSVVGVFATTAFVANAVVRDYDRGTDGIFFSTPMPKSAFLVGRFGGAFTISVLIFVWVALALVVGSFMPWLEPERVGPFLVSPYLYAFAALVIPNLFLTSAIFFGVATLTRSMMGTYVSLVGFFVGYGVAGTFLQDVESERLAVLLDPFGLAGFQIATQYWTTAERNSRVLGLDGALLQNRLLWVGVGIAVLALAFWRFSFTVRSTRGKGEADEPAEPGDRPPGLPGAAAPGAAARHPRDTSFAGALRQLLHHSAFEVRSVVRSAPFLILLAMGVLNLVGSASVVEQLFGTPVHPRTYIMFQVIGSSFLLFAVIILTFYSGRLVWRERSAGLDEVHDALPVPNWVLWGAKLVALTAAIVAVLAVAVGASMGVQLYHGMTDLQPLLYVQGAGLVIGYSLILMGVLALLTQVVTNHEYAGFLLMIVYYLAVFAILPALDLNHNLYRYAQTPAAPYSEMNGFGHFVDPVAWFYLYWTFAAVGILVLVHLLWVRGKETSLRARLALLRQRFNVPTAAALGVAALGFVGTGGWIFYNTNVLNTYVPPDEQRDRQAAYEKTYAPFDGIPQPRITAAYAEVDIHPYERAVDIRGRYTVRNKEAVAIDSLHLLWAAQTMDELELDVPESEVALDDPDFGYRIYELAEPLAPGDEIEVGFRVAVRTEGFVNSGSNTDLVYNGTFFNSVGYFPHIGYNDAFELTDPVERRRRDLPPVERMASLYDSTRYDTNYLSAESDWIDFETIVSTTEDQVALAPGYLEREWTEDGRRYFHYRMDAPILGFWSYLSAAWEVARDSWNDVDIAVYHHPDHDDNVERMIEAAKASLDDFSREFGPYQHRQLRIVEFPAYATFAQSFPTTIPFSEAIGFIARLDDPEDIDYVYYVTAHEVAHQWWAHQVIGADVQGATVTTETMAQYSALMVQEEEYGPELMRRFLRYELDSYLQGRGGERIGELPLFRVENQPYIHYRKGSLSTYALRDYIGEEAFNRAMRRYVSDVGFSGPPYTTTLEYLDYLTAEVPPEHMPAVEDLFRTITLWELEATDASWTPTGDGRYRVRIEVDATKVRADGEGNETEVEMDDLVDIAVFGAEAEGSPPEGRVLFLEKRRVTGGEGVIEVVVDEEPRNAGIDPFNKLIDRDPGNNVTSVKRGG